MLVDPKNCGTAVSRLSVPMVVIPNFSRYMKSKMTELQEVRILRIFFTSVHRTVHMSLKSKVNINIFECMQ